MSKRLTPYQIIILTNIAGFKTALGSVCSNQYFVSNLKTHYEIHPLKSGPIYQSNQFEEIVNKWTELHK